MIKGEFIINVDYFQLPVLRFHQDVWKSSHKVKREAYKRNRQVSFNAHANN